MLTYLRFRKNLSLSLLHAVPEFGSALLHIFRLIQELSEVQFFPDRPAETYQFSILDFASNAQRCANFVFCKGLVLNISLRFALRLHRERVTNNILH